MAELPPFEDTPVRLSSIKITKAGDGLSKALEFEPVALHLGDEVFFVLRGVVAQVNHKPKQAESDELVRLHTIDTSAITMVDRGQVEAMLEEAAEKVRAQEEAAEAERRRVLAEEEEAARLEEEREAGIMRLDDAEVPDVPAPAEDEVKKARAKRAAAGDA